MKSRKGLHLFNDRHLSLSFFVSVGLALHTGEDQATDREHACVAELQTGVCTNLAAFGPFEVRYFYLTSSFFCVFVSGGSINWERI